MVIQRLRAKVKVNLTIVSRRCSDQHHSLYRVCSGRRFQEFEIFLVQILTILHHPIVPSDAYSSHFINMLCISSFVGVYRHCVILPDAVAYPTTIVLAIEDLSDLFQTVTFRLGEQEPRCRQYEYQQDTEYNEISPTQPV